MCSAKTVAVYHPNLHLILPISSLRLIRSHINDDILNHYFTVPLYTKTGEIIVLSINSNS